ncbi:glycerol-3-phosphate dehydrogenase subunit GlpB, partial [Aeromonas veronii]
ARAGSPLFDHHPIMGFGVNTHHKHRVLRGGKPLTNHNGPGSVFAHYDPNREGYRSRVADATGWQAAGQILGAAQ